MHGYVAYCMKHGHDWQPMKVPHSSSNTDKCAVCGAMRKRFKHIWEYEEGEL